MDPCRSAGCVSALLFSSLLLSLAGKGYAAGGVVNRLYGRHLKQNVERRIDAEGDAEINGVAGLTVAQGPEMEAFGPVEELVDKTCFGQVVFFLEAKFNWTEDRHPVGYPDDARWSPMFGAVHNELFDIFSVGSNASFALEEIAEQGTGKLLKRHVEACIEEGNCREFLMFECDKEDGNCRMEGNFTVNTTFSHVSMVSMLQPSPDWFTGLELNLCNDGGWQSELDLDLHAYDAGTDAGKSYTSKDKDIPIALRKGVLKFDKLSPSNPFFDPDFVPLVIEVEDDDDDDDEAPPVELGGLADVLHLLVYQDRETAETDVTGTGEAVTEDIDRDALTDEELDALDKIQAEIRTIGPENKETSTVSITKILAWSALLGYVGLLM